MSKLDKNIADGAAEQVAVPLSASEIAQLRRLLSIVRYDPRQAAIVIETGRARLTLRDDGTICCDGAEVVITADRTITLNGAAIELN